MDRSWDFIVKAESFELEPLKRILLLTQNADYKNKFDENQFSVEDFVCELLNRMFTAYEYENIISFKDLFTDPYTALHDNKKKKTIPDIQNVSFCEFLKSLSIEWLYSNGSNVDIHYFLNIETQEKDTENYYNLVLKRIYNIYLDSLNRDELADFAKHHNFIESDLDSLKKDVNLRLSHNCKFHENAIDYLFEDIQKKLVHGIGNNLSIAINVRSQINLFEEGDLKIAYGGRVPYVYLGEMEFVQIPLIWVVALMYFHKLNTEEFDSFDDAKEYLNNILRKSSNSKDLAFYILANVVKESLKYGDELLYNKLNAALIELNYHNQTIPRRYIEDLKNCELETVDFLYKRILSIQSVYNNQDYDNISELDRIMNSNGNIYSFLNYIPYLQLTDNCTFARKQNEFYHLLDCIYLFICEYDYNKVIKEYSKEDTYNLICFSESKNGDVLGKYNIPEEKSFEIGATDATMVSAYDVIKSIIKFSEEVDVSDAKNITKLKKQSFNDFVYDFFSHRKEIDEVPNDFRIFLEKSFEIERENQRLNKNLDIYRDRLEFLNQVLHRVRHEISPKIGYIKGRLAKQCDMLGAQTLNVLEGFFSSAGINFVAKGLIQNLESRLTENIKDMYSTLRDQNLRYISILDEIILNIDSLVEVSDKDLLTKIKSEEIDITSIIQEVCKIHSNDDFQIILDTESNDSIFVMADEEIKSSVFENIISNAVRHGFIDRNHSNKIRIETIEYKDMVKVIISNNGKSFHGDVDKVFNYKVAYGETAHTGEGLYIVRNYMNLIGGEATFISNPDDEFSVSIVLTFIKGKNGKKI